MIFVIFCSLLSLARGFLLALSAAGQASLPWVHHEACLDLGEFCGGARRVKRRLAGSIWQGITFHPPETNR